MKINRIAFSILVVAAAALSHAQGVVGKWHGHIKLDASVLKQVPPSQMASIMEVQKVVPELIKQFGYKAKITTWVGVITAPAHSKGSDGNKVG